MTPENFFLDISSVLWDNDFTGENMGWLHTYNQTKDELIGACLYGASSPTGFKCIGRSLRGNHLWAAFENETNENFNVGHCILSLYLLDYDRSVGWGYKVIDEWAHPYYYDCPQKLLKLVPPPPIEKVSVNQVGKSWRQMVYDWHHQQKLARRKAKGLVEGNKIRLPVGFTPREFTILDTKPIRAQGSDGLMYKLQPRHIKKAEILGPV